MSFADNSSTNFTELLDEFSVYSGATFAVIITALTCSTVFLFPFYAYLNIINRPQDKQRAVFPFLNLFFKIICVSVALTLSYIVYAIIIKIRSQNNDASETSLYQSGGFILALPFIATMINMPVCQLLTSILAFHRFLLYFFPRIGDFLTPGKKAAKILICLLYLVVVVGMVIFSYIATKNEGLEESGSSFNDSQVSIWNKSQIFRLFFIGLGLSELLISIPYTFMILSIRKLTRLASAIQSRPEKYIAYQIVITFVLKSISFLSAFLLPYLWKEDFKISLIAFIIIEMLTFPLSVQLAYILSNKKNVDSLIAVITGKMMFWKNRARVEVETSTRF